MKGIVKASALLAIILCGCTGQVNEGPDSLKEAYDGCFKIGCAVNCSIVTGRDTAQLALVMKHFDAISPENDLKPEERISCSRPHQLSAAVGPGPQGKTCS